MNFNPLNPLNFMKKTKKAEIKQMYNNFFEVMLIKKNEITYFCVL